MIWMFLPTDVPGPANYAVYYTPLDGDLDHVDLIDQTIDIGDSTLMSVQKFASGRHVHTEKLPTRVQLSYSRGAPRKGQVPVPDYIKTRHARIVSDALRSIIDAHDAGQHQFVPVSLEWASGETVETPFHWFFPGIRLFALDKERTQPPLMQPSGYLDIGGKTSDWKMVFRSDIVSKNDLFCTGEMSGYIFVGERLWTAIESAGMTGVRFRGPYDLV